jgi:hypothetical protein
MKLHGSAAPTPNQRLRLARGVVEQDWSLGEAAEAAEVSERTARKWVARYREESDASVADRPSAARSQAGATAEDRIQAIAALRRVRLTGAEIWALGMALSTVQGILTRIGLGKLSRLEPPEPPNRYELPRPSQLVHVDVKRLGRISVRRAGHGVTGNRRSQFTVRDRGSSNRVTGWAFVHVMVDDHSRLACAEVFQGKGENARQAVAFYRCHGIRVERVMLDNGSGYVSPAHAIACRALRIKHLRTRPYRPRTNGKACVLASWCRPVGRRGCPRPAV